MANIAIVKMFHGMTITGAQLAGELIEHGHQAKVIYFKRGELHPLRDYDPARHQLGDVPMYSFQVGKTESEYLVSLYQNTKPHELRHLVTLVKELNVDAIGISTLSMTMTLAEEVTKHLRMHFNVPILWGGTGPTTEPDRSIKSANLVCVGEGEGVLVEIADRLDKKQSLDGIPGTWYRYPDGTIQKNPKRQVSDLEKIAMPNWESQHYAFINGPRFDRVYDPSSQNIDKSYQMMTQRGCPFSCSFCIESFYQNEFGKKDSLRRMSPEKAIRELRVAKDKLGYKTVTFMDDVFTVNPRWLEQFLSLYKKEIDLPFFCYTYPTTHNPKMLAMLEQAGCHAMTMGIQSGSYRILTEVYNRPTKIGRVVKAAQEIIESGIPAVTFDLIPQTEFDREEDLRETFELLLEVPKAMDTSFYNTLVYFPNYPIQEKFKDQQLLATSQKLTSDDYIYYFKLYELTRSSLPVEEIRAIGNNPIYRHNHKLLDSFLPDRDELIPNYGQLIELGIERRKMNTKTASLPGQAVSN